MSMSISFSGADNAEFNVVNHVLGYPTSVRVSDVVDSVVGTSLDFFNDIEEIGLYPDDGSEPAWLEEKVEEYLRTAPPEDYLDILPTPAPQDPSTNNSLINEEYLCKICRMQMYSESDLQKHLIVVHSIRVFTTNKVVHHAGGGGVFTKQKHVCPNCDKGFKLKIDYLAHRCISAPLKCIFCATEFPCLGVWKSHTIKRHLCKTINLECVVCGSTLSSRHNLVCHYATHVTTHRYECPFCYDKLTGNKSCYKTLKGISSHLKTHPEDLVENYEDVKVVKAPNYTVVENPLAAVSATRENFITFHQFTEAT